MGGKLFCALLLAAWTVAASAAALARQTLFVIGDTGDCRELGAAQVAAAIRAQADWTAGWLIEVGDLAYPAATRERLAACHEPHFGMFARRLAVPGNHDWRDADATGFRSLFPEPLPRAVALDARWQLWLLDSNLRGAAWESQLQWLEMRAQGGACVIAAWHHPRWSLGSHGDNRYAAPLWDRVAGIATLTLHGHDHHYEALPPLDKAGSPVAAGTRSFVVGNGGAALYPPGRVAKPSTAIYGKWGFLRLDIEGDRYAWRALGTRGETLDAGSGKCLQPATTAAPKQEPMHGPRQVL